MYRPILSKLAPGTRKISHFLQTSYITSTTKFLGLLGGHLLFPTEQVPSSYSTLGYLVDGLASLVLLLTGELLLGGGTGGGSAGQSACDVTGGGGGVVAIPLIGGLLVSNGIGAGDCWTAAGASGTS